MRTHSHYDVPDLFPDFYRKPTMPARRKAMTAQLVELAERNALYVTDLFQLPHAQKELAGQILLGQGIDDNGTPVNHPLPPALAKYTVRIRSLFPGWTISYDMPGQTATGLTLVGDSRFQLQAEAENGGAFNILEKNHVATGKTKMDLPLPDAWMCLKEHGKYCKRVIREVNRGKYWKCEEVRPEAKPEPITESEHNRQELDALKAELALLRSQIPSAPAAHYDTRTRSDLPPVVVSKSGKVTKPKRGPGRPKKVQD